METPNSIHVAAGIFIKDDKVLACRRAPHKSSPGLWEFPGGKVEKGESVFDALQREISEELGFTCQPNYLFDTSVTELGDSLIKLESVICGFNGPETLISTDHDAFRWLQIEELFLVEWAMPDLPSVRNLSNQASLASLVVSRGYPKIR